MYSIRNDSGTLEKKVMHNPVHQTRLGCVNITRKIQYKLEFKAYSLKNTVFPNHPTSSVRNLKRFRKKTSEIWAKPQPFLMRSSFRVSTGKSCLGFVYLFYRFFRHFNSLRSFQIFTESSLRRLEIILFFRVQDIFFNILFQKKLEVIQYLDMYTYENRPIIFGQINRVFLLLFVTDQSRNFHQQYRL